MLTKSARCNNSFNDTISTLFSRIKSGAIGIISFPRIFIPNPRARRITAFPILPRPMTPNVHSERDRPGILCHSPIFISRSIQGWRRAKASMYEIIVSATGKVNALGVFFNWISNSRQAFWSMESIPVPHLEMTFNLGEHFSNTRLEYWSSPQMVASNLPAYFRMSSSSIRSSTSGAMTSSPKCSNTGINRCLEGII